MKQLLGMSTAFRLPATVFVIFTICEFNHYISSIIYLLFCASEINKCFIEFPARNPREFQVSFPMC